MATPPLRATRRAT